MTPLTDLLGKWPLIRQIRKRTDVAGVGAMSDEPWNIAAEVVDAIS